MPATYWRDLTASRVTRRRALAAAGGMSLGSALLAACGGGSQSKETKPAASGLISPTTDETKSVKRGGTLRLNLTADISTFDPHTTDQPNQTPTVLAYNQLFRVVDGYLKPTNGEIEGDLVESWEYSADKLQITAKINQNAHWAPLAPVNGRQVDAEDVVFSWDRFKAQGSRRLEYSTEASKDAPILSMTSTDAKTVVIKINEPNATILPLLAKFIGGSFYIVPKEAREQSALDLRRTQLGTGAWYSTNYTPSVGVTYKRNPGFKQDKRDVPYIDQLEYPIVPEYAAGLAQFKAGNIYSFLVRAEDQIATKKDVPELVMGVGDLTGTGTLSFFGQLPESPFKDERVRQAWSMSRDRDLLIDVIFGVSAFTKEGLPMITAWDSAFQATTYEGWWLDPKGKDFGPNAKYYQHDVAEAKKLLAAAGYASGLDTNVHYPATGYTTAYYKHIELLLGMVTEAGFRPKLDLVNFNTEWTPKFRDVRGRFDGTAFIASTTDDPNTVPYTHFNTAGSQYQGGDATMDDLTNKIRQEFDTKKRIALVQDFQRYNGQKQFKTFVGGSANTFTLNWPVVRNVGVWRGGFGRLNAAYFIDPDQAPLKKA